MYNWVKVALAVLIVVLAVVWFGIGFQLVARWTAPLGPALVWPDFPPPAPEVDSNQPDATAAAKPANDLQGFDPPATSAIQLAAEPSPTVGTPHCGGPARMILLVIGSDTRASGYMYGLADVIRVGRIDFITASVTVLEFPRDLWVEIPGIAERGITHEKLNQSYLYGNRGFGYYNGPDLGPGLLARTLYLNFGIWPDHYLAVNMQTFARLVDVLGGIEINLPYTVDGRMEGQEEYTNLLFLPGPQRLKGSEALMLARLRTGVNTDRSTHQGLIACALRDAALKPSNLSRLPDIIDSFYGSVQTDLSPREISALLCLMGQVSPSDIRFVSFPAGSMQAGRVYDPVFRKEVFAYEADFEQMRVYTADFLDGNWPPPQDPASSGSRGIFSCP